MEESIRDVAIARGDVIDASILNPTRERIWKAVLTEEEMFAKRTKQNLGETNIQKIISGQHITDNSGDKVTLDAKRSIRTQQSGVLVAQDSNCSTPNATPLFSPKEG